MTARARMAEQILAQYGAPDAVLGPTGSPDMHRLAPGGIGAGVRPTNGRGRSRCLPLDR